MIVQGLKPEPTADAERVVAFRLRSGTLAFGQPPREGQEIPRESHETAAIVRRALEALSALETAAENAALDANLSEAGRQRATEALRTQARTALLDAQIGLQRYAEQVVRLEAEITAPPKLEPSNVVEGLVDLELRGLIRTTTGEAKALLLAQLAEEPRLQEAVLRSPLPLGLFSQQAREAWTQAQLATDPRAPQLARSKAARDWASSALRAIEQFVPSANSEGSNGRQRP